MVKAITKPGTFRNQTGVIRILLYSVFGFALIPPFYIYPRILHEYMMHEYDSIKFNLLNNENDSPNYEEETLPICNTSWKEIYDPENPPFAPPNKDIQLLPPFTSGQPPICSLHSSVETPIPVIFSSFGRSGSSATWQVLSRLTGHCFEIQEYTGEHSKDAAAFFSRIKPGNNGNWILGYLCNQQIKYKGKGGIIGFKWKPNKPSIYNNASLDGLQMIAHYTDPPHDDNPQIKIISSTRNPLDVILSRIKHYRMDDSINEHMRIPHCRLDDVKCIEEHKKFGIGLHVPTENLMITLKKMRKDGRKYNRLLLKMNVPHIKVSYEKLFYGDNANEWKRIFLFLGRGPAHNLSRNLVEKAMEHVGTSSPFHNVTISNYEEVRDMLIGTNFERLLH